MFIKRPMWLFASFLHKLFARTSFHQKRYNTFQWPNLYLIFQINTNSSVLKIHEPNPEWKTRNQKYYMIVLKYAIDPIMDMRPFFRKRQRCTNVDYISVRNNNTVKEIFCISKNENMA